MVNAQSYLILGKGETITLQRSMGIQVTFGSVALPIILVTVYRYFIHGNTPSLHTTPQTVACGSELYIIHKCTRLSAKCRLQANSTNFTWKNFEKPHFPI